MIKISFLKFDIFCLFQSQPSTTCENSTNPYTFIKTAYYHDACPEGARIDYVLYRNNPRTIDVTCKESQLVMGKIPGESGMNYSDHEGVEATFVIQDVTGMIYCDF